MLNLFVKTPDLKHLKNRDKIETKTKCDHWVKTFKLCSLKSSHFTAYCAAFLLKSDTNWFYTNGYSMVVLYSYSSTQPAPSVFV